MKHIDLFSGIGGFSLAVDAIFNEQENEHIFVEWDAFCQAILKKHWPNAEIHGDIRSFVADTDRERCIHREPKKLTAKPEHEAQRESVSGIEPPFLLTGGFPCQPFSHAGRRKGTEDDRYLWPEMRDAIALFKPQWVIAENVAGLASWNDGLVLETVCTDLEAQGYEVQPFVIPACAVGAPHRRDRIWFVARNTEYDGQHGSKNSKSSFERSDSNSSRQNENEQSSRPALAWNNASHSERTGHSGKEHKTGQGSRCNRGRLEIQWQEDWTEVATRLCAVDDGLSAGLVRPRGWRNAALKAAGNAIVPQVAMEIMKAIKETL